MKSALTLLMLCIIAFPFCSVCAEDLEPENLVQPTNDRRISLEMEDVDIRTVLQVFAEVMHLNLVAHPKVTGRVRQLHLVDVPINQTFEILLRRQGLYAAPEDPVIIIYPVETYLTNARQRLGHQ